MLRKRTIFALVLIVFFQIVSGTHRRHKGPPPGHQESILRGRTVTSSKESTSSAPSASASVQTMRASSPNKRRIVDFALHLRRDVVLWDEVKTDDASMSACRIFKTGKAVFTLTGKDLDLSDYDPRTVFVVDETDFERCSKHPTPALNGIDSADNYLFLSISFVTVKNSGKIKKIHLTATVTPGSLVVPTIDIDVHEKSEPRAIRSMKSKVEYGDEPHSKWNSRRTSRPITRTFAADMSQGHRRSNQFTGSQKFANGSISIPSYSRLSLYRRVIPVGEDAHIELTANADVRISSFRLRRVRGLHFEWKQQLTASVNARLVAMKALVSHEKSGHIIRAYVPSLSFSVRVPVAGSVQAGGFIGLNWVRQFGVTRAATARISAVFRKKQKVSAQLYPLSFDIQTDEASASGSGDFDVTGGYSSSLSMHGFFGVRPVVGIGVTHERRRLRRRGWRLYWNRERTSIGGNVGADLGGHVSVVHKDPPFPAYKGSGTTIGGCNTCHSVQGRLSLKGKNLSIQAVKNGEVERSIVVARRLFEVPVGTVCAMNRTCSTTRNVL